MTGVARVLLRSEPIALKHKPHTNQLPLPLGEGWGEGLLNFKGAPRHQNSSQLRQRPQSGPLFSPQRDTSAQRFGTLDKAPVPGHALQPHRMHLPHQFGAALGCRFQMSAV